MSYRIGELAKECNVNKETIRYYERIGVILEPPRTESGYRLYPEEAAERIHFIKRMQGLDFSLNEINRLLGVVDKDPNRCLNMYDFTTQKLDEIEKKIKDLIQIKKMLDDLRKRCPDEKEIYECPIFESLITKEDLIEE
ncbi:Hg(II)-responsive transcriptional regulator [Virgibacillus byunsanensis]|uniref:Mercuric resistance operon regulatory protein n=1 Tax=Virgibacillus byunsanensis TaxID=570945 RepID=A0ABW3LEX6_9BACI